MAKWLGVVVGIVVWSALAHADTFYKYRDSQTGRDVFVNRLDQIPPPYRSRAKVMMEMTAPAKVEVAETPGVGRFQYGASRLAMAVCGAKLPPASPWRWFAIGGKADAQQTSVFVRG